MAGDAQQSSELGEAEIEEQLQSSIRVPSQCLHDFAYNHRALCLKWRPDMTEDEMVRLASGLHHSGAAGEGGVTYLKGLLELDAAE